MNDRMTHEQMTQRLVELEKQLADRDRLAHRLKECEEIVRALLNTPSDAVALLDTNGVILGANRKMADNFNKEPASLAGCRAWDLLPPNIAARKMACVDRVIASGQPLYMENERQGVWSESMFYPVLDEHRRVIKIVLLIHDITQRKKAEQEKEELIGQLREALANVKTLQGLLPICAACKKIRDDRGYWNKIDVYIQNHSNAQFSHGICPDCAKRLNPELYDDLD